MGLSHSRNVYPQQTSSADTQQTSLVDVSLALGIGTVDSGITLAALAEDFTDPGSKQASAQSQFFLSKQLVFQVYAIHHVYS